MLVKFPIGCNLNKLNLGKKIGELPSSSKTTYLNVFGDGSIVRYVVWLSNISMYRLAESNNVVIRRPFPN